MFRNTLRYSINTVDGRNPAPGGKYPVIYMVLHIAGGAGRQSSAK